jgi:Carboxypeptidase regulatory-like domain
LNCFNPQRFSALKIRAVILFLTLFSISAYCAARNLPQSTNANAQKAEPAPAQISGHVRRADTGAPIAKAEVTLVPLGPNPDVTRDWRFFAVTDAEGAFTINNIRPGTYVVIANHSGFVARNTYSDQEFNDPESIDLSARQVLDKVDIHLVPAGVISGTVSDEDNEPIADVTVEAVRLHYFPGGRQVETRESRVFTDDQGSFRLHGLPSGNYFVRIEVTNVSAKTGTLASRAAYYPGTPEVENAQPLRVTPGNELSGIHFSVPPLTLYSITGNVVDSSGFAGQGRYQLMAMNAIDLANDGGRITRGITGAGGSFILNGLPDGTYSIYAGQLEPESTRISEKGSSGSALVRISDGDARVNIQVSADAEVSGRIAVENPSGKALGGFTVMLWPRNSIVIRPAQNSPKATTERNGTFRIRYVSAGNFDFLIPLDTGMYLKQTVCNGRDYTLAPLTIEGGTNVNDCVLTLGTDAGAINGQVLDGDKPVRGRVVVAIPEEVSKRSLQRFVFLGKTNPNGEYQLSSVIPGDYLLFAVPPDDAETYFDVNFADRNLRDAERVTVKSSETKTVALKPSVPQ